MRAIDFEKLKNIPAASRPRAKIQAPVKEITPEDLLTEPAESEYFELDEDHSVDFSADWCERLKALDPDAYHRLRNWD